METLNCEESLEWSVFSAALTSYKYGSFVESELIIHEDKKELERLSNQISDKLLIEKYNNVELDYLKKFKTHKNFSLQLCPSETYDCVFKSYANDEKVEVDYDNILLFKVDRTDSYSASQKQFEELKEKYGIIKGMHGSSVTSFYSILQNGLRYKESFKLPGLYGDGVYFSTKLDIALQFARSFTFSYGLFKDRSLQIVALCEMINDPNVVLKADQTSGKNKIPPEYILVKDDTLIRVTHILVKLSCGVTELNNIRKQYILNASNQQNLHPPQSIFNRFFNQLLLKMRQNSLLTILMIYGLILIYVHVLSSNSSLLFSNWDSQGDIFED